MFQALLLEDQAMWVGLLRGVEQSLLAKHRLAQGRMAVEGKLNEAATALWAKYEAYTVQSRSQSSA